MNESENNTAIAVSKDEPVQDKTVVECKQDEIEQKVLNGEMSFFDLAIIPYKNKPYEFTPKDVKNVFEDYSVTITGLEPLLEKHKVHRHSFYFLLEHYAELREVYELSFYRKAECFEDEAIRQYAEDIPEQFFEETSYGVKKLSYGGVKYIENKANFMMRLAGVHNREIYGDRTQIDSRSLNVNINKDANMSNDPGIQEITENLFVKFRKVR